VMKAGFFDGLGQRHSREDKIGNVRPYVPGRTVS
jgi:hypothetical protein